MSSQSLVNLPKLWRGRYWVYNLGIGMDMSEPKLEIRTGIYSTDEARSVLGTERKQFGVPIPPEELTGLFSKFEHSAFRFETLPSYAVAHEDAHYAAYREGKQQPPFRYANWEAVISSAVKAGRSFEIVRVIPEPLTEYFSYEVEWHYLIYEDLGQRTRFMHTAALPNELRELLGADFWLFDDSVAVTIEYNKVGDVISFLKITDPDQIAMLVDAKNLAIKASFSLGDFMKTYKSVRQSS